MTHAEAIAAIACIPGVTQEMVDAIEDGLRDAERARDDLGHRLGRAEAALDFQATKLARTEGRLSCYEKRAEAAASPLPF